jgi:hypothetical protein
MKSTHSQQLHQTKLDNYPVKEQQVEKKDVIPIKVIIINVKLSTQPAERMLARRVDILVSVVRDSQNRMGYALQTKVRDTLLMMGIVRDDNEFERLVRIAYGTRRIRERGDINGAWVVSEAEVTS